jgi:hypothetical protein
MSDPNGLPEPEFPAIEVDVLYRIYGIRDAMPPLEALLARLTSGNPYNPPGSFVFPPGAGMRRLQDALGASRDYFVMGYTREEAPDLFSDGERAARECGPGLDDHDRAIAREARLCVVLRAQIRNPESNAYIETLVHLADAFRDLLHGVVWDVRMGRVFGHEEWRDRVMGEAFSVLNHVSVEVARGEAGAAVRTRGLRKFGSPDLEVRAVPAGVEDDVGSMLRDFAEHISQGEIVAPGDRIDYTHGSVCLVAAGTKEDPLLRVADADDEAAEGAHGAPKLFEALAKARRDAEGKRAGGGRPAEN